MQISLLQEYLSLVGEQVSSALGLPRLSRHFSTLLVSFLFWNAIQYVISPIVSPLISKTYARGPQKEHLSTPNKHNQSSDRATNGDRVGPRRGVKSLKGWHSHSVALVHAIVIIPLAFQCLNLPALDGPRERAFGWDDKAGFVHAIASGYFLWDIFDAVAHFESIGFILHGIACFTVFSLSYRPFLTYYGPRFLLWELSTPFLNINWFFDRTGFKGGKIHLINGVSLLISFFSARLIYGTYMSYNFYQTALYNRAEIPAALFWTYAVGNVVLNGLNWFW
ncbi:hypothetical protein CPB86DRAFT_703920 [Serendipita vermifera]|nr:hypothetical protein CPB86DRAFT_703920 [Serendipita vermifera]